MINDNRYTNKAVPLREAARPVQESGVLAQLIVLAMHIPPTAYVVLTGTVPRWARLWLAGWLSVWLLVTVVKALQNQGRS
jgi:hypothetical protein